MHHRVEYSRLERLRFVAEQSRISDIARHYDDLFFDVRVEIRAKMRPHWRHRRRVENLAPVAADRAPPIAADQQIDLFDFRMPPKQHREKNFAEKSGRTGHQDAPALEHLLERRHRGCAPRTVSSVATRHPRSP